MKKLLLFAVLIAFTSCSKNDDSKNDIDTPIKDYKTLILGSWKYDKYETFFSSTKKSKIGYYDNCTKKSILTFNDKGKYIDDFYEFIDNKCRYFQELMIYSVQDNKILLSYYDTGNDKIIKSDDYKIIKLTKNELIFEIKIGDEDDDGLPEMVRQYFKR